jgi:hypothetical protein
MLTFLFWNLQKKRLEQRVARIARHHHVDVVILAESIIPASVMLETLNPPGTALYHQPFSNCDKVRIYTRFGRDYIHPVQEEARFTIQSIELPGVMPLLLVAAHLQSRLHWNAESISSGCKTLSDDIRAVETDKKHSNTILVGDLNLNPFDVGLVTANGLHAVMTPTVAQREGRIIDGRSYPFFYNPMWSHFGDRGPNPPGTYYYPDSQHMVYFWHMYDQVLLRPELLPYFDHSHLQILTDDGTELLVTRNGLPDTRNASDHLPLLFRLSLPNTELLYGNARPVA